MLDVLHRAFAKSFDTFKDYALQHFFTIAPGIQPIPTSTQSSLHIPSQDDEEELDAELDALRQRKAQVDSDLRAAKLTRDTWKKKVEMATHITQQLTQLSHEFNTNAERDLVSICSTIHNLQKQIEQFDAYKL